jgi:hypothetical protein
MTITRAKLAAAAAAVAIILGVILADHWIVTDSERIERVLEGMADALNARDEAALLARVSPRFSAEDLDREDIRDWVRHLLDRVRAPSVRIRDVESRVAPKGNFAAVLASVRADAGEGSYFRHMVWYVEFTRNEAGAWQVSGLTPQKWGPVDFADGWDDFIRMVRRGGRPARP